MILRAIGSVYTLNGRIAATFGRGRGDHMAQRKRRRIDPDVYNEIHRQVREGNFTNAAELHRHLVQKFPADAPSERTVRNIVKELTPSDSSGIWRPGPDTDPEEAALILSALAKCISRWQDRSMLPITNDRARWLAWLLKGWPDLDPMTALVLATDYLARSETEKSTEDLDGFLAFTPWRSAKEALLWQKARDKGLPSPPIWYVLRIGLAAVETELINANMEVGIAEYEIALAKKEPGNEDVRAKAKLAATKAKLAAIKKELKDEEVKVLNEQ